MGVARGDPPSREYKATHNSSTIEDKNPGKKKEKMEVVGSMLVSCTLVVRGGGMVGKKKKITGSKLNKTSSPEFEANIFSVLIKVLCSHKKVNARKLYIKPNRTKNQRKLKMSRFEYGFTQLLSYVTLPFPIF